MAPPKTPRDVIDAIRSLWAEDPKQSAIKVWKRYCNARGHADPPAISHRKVQLIIADAKSKSTDRGYPLVEWRPWRNETESRDDAAHLLRLDAISMATFGRHLYQHEAKWGRRLRTALEGLSPWEQYIVATTYAAREVAAYHLRESSRPYTADLDGILAYRLWEPQNRQAYEDAVLGGAVPVPLGWGADRMREQLDTYRAYYDGAIDVETYRKRISYWIFALRMFEQRPRRALHIDREKALFKAKPLDRALDFWAKDELHSLRDFPFLKRFYERREAKLKGENDERNHPTKRQE